MIKKRTAKIQPYNRLILGCAVRAIMTSACIIRLSIEFMMYPVMMCAASFLRKYKNWYGTFVIA